MFLGTLEREPPFGLQGAATVERRTTWNSVRDSGAEQRCRAGFGPPASRSSLTRTGRETLNTGNPPVNTGQEEDFLLGGRRQPEASTPNRRGISPVILVRPLLQKSQAMGILKVDLHTHSSDDPVDVIPHSTRDLIDRAASLGLHGLAITLHEQPLQIARHLSYAADRGVVLIPGVERSIEGRHVLLINFPNTTVGIRSFADLERLKHAHPAGLVVAPHPFYPHPTCLGRLAYRHADLFDAVEYNAFYTRFANFNRGAVRWSGVTGKPLVGNSDAHRLSLLGRTVSVVEADASADGICAAIKAGRTRVCTRPLTALAAGVYFASLTFAGRRDLRLPDRAPAPTV
jgi:hypothetical protein